MNHIESKDQNQYTNQQSSTRKDQSPNQILPRRPRNTSPKIKPTGKSEERQPGARAGSTVWRTRTATAGEQWRPFEARAPLESRKARVIGAYWFVAVDGGFLWSIVFDARAQAMCAWAARDCNGSWCIRRDGILRDLLGFFVVGIFDVVIWMLWEKMFLNRFWVWGKRLRATVMIYSGLVLLGARVSYEGFARFLYFRGKCFM